MFPFMLTTYRLTLSVSRFSTSQIRSCNCILLSPVQNQLWGIFYTSLYLKCSRISRMFHGVTKRPVVTLASIVNKMLNAYLYYSKNNLKLFHLDYNFGENGYLSN